MRRQEQMVARSQGNKETHEKEMVVWRGLAAVGMTVS